MFTKADWPRTDEGWERYDRKRTAALKDIHDARKLRGFGKFDLVSCLRSLADPKNDKKVKASLDGGATKFDLVAYFKNHAESMNKNVKEGTKVSSSGDSFEVKASPIGEHSSLP